MNVTEVELMADQERLILTVVFSTEYGPKVFYMDKEMIIKLCEELYRVSHE